MAKSEISGALDQIQRLVAVVLKERGFRKSGRTFNRHTSGSLVHVVNFQMGQWPVGNYVVPGLRESAYGKFTVNLGIALPDVRRIEGRLEEKKVYQEYDCEIRERLGSLAKGGADVWWEICPPVETIASDLSALFRSHGFPFLERFESYDDVILEFGTTGKLPFSNEGRSALVIAMLHHARNDEAAAAEAFRRAKAYPTKNPGFLRYVGAIEDACRKRANKAPEPTPGAVTPRATEGTSK